MTLYKIKKFSEIDFVEVDPSSDEFKLPDGEMYHFSDHMCDFCWSGGTVLETSEGEKKYYCVICRNFLDWCEHKNDFLPPKGDMLRFLLPEKWSEEEKNQWYDDFKKRRLEQEKVRKRILDQGKE